MTGPRADPGPRSDQPQAQPPTLSWRGLDLTEFMSRMYLLIRTYLWAQILVAMALGIGLGVLLSPSGAAMVRPELALEIAHWIALPGKVFLALIQMVVIPLVVSSVAVGLNSTSDPSFLAKVGLRIAPYFVVTTLIAVLIGIAVAMAIEPGAFVDAQLVAHAGQAAPAASTAGPQTAAQASSIPDTVVSLIPSQALEAVLAGDMLKIVIGAIIFGVALVSMPRDQATPLLKLLESAQLVSMTVVGWAMMLAPYAVFGLLCDITIRVGLDAILGMGVYVGTVLLGLVALYVFYLLNVWVLGRRSALTFASRIREAQLLAFSTSSSAAVMPLSIETAEQRMDIPAPIAKFVIPLGATVNMAGTALYQAAAAVFLMQVYGIEITAANLTPMIMTTVGASIGSPSTPGVGIVILSTILTQVGVPAEGIALIIGVDRILDMARTAVNVTGDLAACVVLSRWLRHEAPSSPSDDRDAVPASA